MSEKLVPLLYLSWEALDTAVAGLSAPDASVRHDGASPIAWSVGHVTHMVDSWLNVHFQGLAPDPVINDPMFYTGAPGETKDWDVVLTGVADVRARAGRLLDADPDLDRVVPYHGSIAMLRPTGLRLGYALMRIAAHHFMHAGEIMAVRSRLGHTFPGLPDWGPELI